MTMNEAVIKRIEELCEQYRLSISKLSLKGGITPSVIYDIKNKGKVPSVITLKKLCNGLSITLSQFFDRDYFNEIEFDL